MQNNDESVLIEPGAFNKKLEARENALLAILPPYLSMARAMAGAWRGKRRVDWGGVWNVPARRGGFSVAGPAVGACVAAMMLETLIARGARRVIAVGCCGAIREDVKIGDIIIVESALSEEGATPHYRPDAPEPRADERLVGILEETAKRKGWNAKTGGVWTTDAPYRETCRKVKEYGGRGLAGVEMEMSALFSVAAYRGAQAAGVLAVSDELSSLQWKRGFFDPKFLSASRRAVKLAIEALKRLK